MNISKIDNDNRCPFTNNDCKEHNCAWFSKKYEECAVLLAGESISDLLVKADDEGVNVRSADDD